MKALFALLIAGFFAEAALASDQQSLYAIADETMEHLRQTSAEVRNLSSLPVTEVDDISPAQAARQAQYGKAMLARIDAIQLNELSDADWVMARILRHAFRIWSESEQNYWLDFAVTPYTGGLRISKMHAAIAAQPLTTQAQCDSYLKLITDFARLLGQIATKTQAQAERNIRVSKPAVASVVAMLQGLQQGAYSTLTPSDDRLKELPPKPAADFRSKVNARIREVVNPAYDRILRIFDEAYVSKAPEEVGISRYPGGREQYERLIYVNTGLQLSPREIHDFGLRRVAEIEHEMQLVRSELNFTGTAEQFREKLSKEPRLYAHTPEEMGQRFLAYIEHLNPLLPKYFSKIPKTPYTVKRLDPALEQGRTFGFYTTPDATGSQGYYSYNASDLDRRSMLSAAHLIYHELMPGHHLEAALQLERANAHPIYRFLWSPSFDEGWAEYAASLGREMGLYADPYDYYGQLSWEGAMAARLVVDTGMNYFEWPLGRGRAYMKAHTTYSDTEIESESLRYSADWFAQALNYYLGYDKFWQARRRAERMLGPRFDIRAFHEAVIDVGSMPLDALDEYVTRYIKEQRGAHP